MFLLFPIQHWKKNNKVKRGDIFVSKSENNKRKQKIFVQTKHALISYFLLTLYFLFLLSLKVLYTFAKYLKILKRRFLYSLCSFVIVTFWLFTQTKTLNVFHYFWYNNLCFAYNILNYLISYFIYFSLCNKLLRAL